MAFVKKGTPRWSPPCKFFAHSSYRTIFRSLQYQKRSPPSMSFCSFIGEHKRNLDGHCLKLGTFCEDWPTQIQMAKTLGDHCCCCCWGWKKICVAVELLYVFFWPKGSRSLAHFYTQEILSIVAPKIWPLFVLYFKLYWRE